MKDIPREDRERIRGDLYCNGDVVMKRIWPIDMKLYTDYAHEEFKRQMNAKGIAVVEKILRDEKEKEGEIKRIVVRK